MIPIQYTGHNVEISQTVRDYVEKRFQRLQKHANRITSLHVIFNADKLLQIAEATVHIPGSEIYARAESEDMYKTIDLLANKLLRQIDKQKGKSGDKRKETV